MPVLNNALSLRLGANKADKIYLGSEKVWPPSGLWTPARMRSSRMWWNSDDISHNGTEVSAWTDRIAGLTLFPLAGLPAPTLDTLGSKTVPFFNGAVMASLTGLAQTMFQATRYGWLFAVYEREGQWSTYANVFCSHAPYRTTGSVTNLRLVLQDNQSGVPQRPSLGSRAKDLDKFAWLNPPSQIQGPIMALITLDWLTSEGAIYANGVELVRGPMLREVGQDWVATNGVSPNTPGYGVGIGGDPDSGEDVHWGKIASVIAGTASLPTQDEVDQLMGWAAHEYGQASLLPIDHPYRDTAPWFD